MSFPLSSSVRSLFQFSTSFVPKKAGIHLDMLGKKERESIDRNCTGFVYVLGKKKRERIDQICTGFVCKTMVARILGKIFYKLGLISTDRVTEVQRTDLVAVYLGQTGPKTRKKIEEARGGILFVDEAYRLIPNCTYNDYGIEALEEIMSAMDNGDIITIFAGYRKDMQRVIDSNEGFTRRVSKLFYFDDYSPIDIASILQSKIDTQDENSFVYGFKLHPDCTVNAVAQLIRENTIEELLKKMNGGLVDPLLVNALENMDLRLDVGCTDVDTLTTITMEDLEMALKFLSKLDG